jgi:hypothetical protein
MYFINGKNTILNKTIYLMRKLKNRKIGICLESDSKNYNIYKKETIYKNNKFFLSQSIISTNKSGIINKVLKYRRNESIKKSKRNFNFKKNQRKYNLQTFTIPYKYERFFNLLLKHERYSSLISKILSNKQNSFVSNFKPRRSKRKSFLSRKTRRIK